MREICMLRLTRRELETGLTMATAPALDPTDEGVLETGPRSALFGHEGGNSRTQTREGPCESPRQHSTLPIFMVLATGIKLLIN